MGKATPWRALITVFPPSASHGRGVLCTTVHPSIPSLEHLPATCQSSYYRNKCRRRRTSSLHALSVARIGDGPSRREMRKHVPLELLYNDPICCTVTHSRIGLSTAIRESHCSPVLEPRAERPHPLMRQCNERERILWLCCYCPLKRCQHANDKTRDSERTTIHARIESENASAGRDEHWHRLGCCCDRHKAVGDCQNASRTRRRSHCSSQHAYRCFAVHAYGLA